MPQEPAVIYDEDSGWYGHFPARLDDNDRALPSYIYNRCTVSGQYRLLCTMRDIWMYGVIRRTCNMKSKRKKQLFSIGRYLTTMVPGSSALNFQAGQAIFCQGDAADAVYYIRRGTVKLT